VTLLDRYGVKRLAAGLVVVVLVLAGPAMTRAADDGSPAVPAPEGDSTVGRETGNDKPAAEKQEAPQLQIQDEGPGSASDRKRQPRIQLAQEGEVVERPYWKNWVFWSVTAAVVIGAAATLVYMSAGKNSDVAPCPVDVAVSLGCFGAGR
jgi:hypothetical protein